MTQVTLHLRDEVYQRAAMVADRSGRPVADVLSESIELSLNPLGVSGNGDNPAEWTNEEVQEAATAKMPAKQDKRLSELLDAQQAGELTEADRAELTALMLTYQRGLLRKAQGLREAVQRGLREPLAP